MAISNILETYAMTRVLSYRLLLEIFETYYEISNRVEDTLTFKVKE